MDDLHKREKDIYLMMIQESPESQMEVCDPKIIDYPEVENHVTIQKYKEGEIKFTYKESSFSPEGIIADSTFFEVFDFKLKVGDQKTILYDPEAAVFTERLARKIFGNENPIGKLVTITSKREKVYTVKGIVENPPSNSSMTFDFILPSYSYSYYSRMGGKFILVGKNFNKSDFVQKMNNQVRNDPKYKKIMQFRNSRLDVMGLNDIYFNENSIDSIYIFSKSGDKKSLNILFLIIGVAFIITMLNFSNLQIININSSIKNIGINKISGAGCNQIFYQKITEIFTLIILSASLITIVFIAVQPYFNRIVGVELSPKIWQIFLLNLFVIILLVASAMVYPSIVYFRIPITSSLKNQIFSQNKLAGRKMLVTIQFALAFILLTASIVVVRQLDLMLKKDLGFTTENVIKTKFFYKPHFSGTHEEQIQLWQKGQNDYQYVKNELASNVSINCYSQGLSPIEPFTMSWKLKGRDKDYTTEKALTITPNYLKILGLELVEGRFFEYEKDKQRGKTIVINEAAKKYWGINDISQAKILNKSWEPLNGYEIIGVVKDFNFEHLSVKPQPLIMLYFENFEDEFLIKFNEGATQHGLLFVQQLFKKFNPGETFQYSFLSDEIDTLYKKEKRLSEIYMLFTIIALSISAIGLFAIALYETRKRTKEIGIRKVNGATIFEILSMLNRDFVKWVAIAFVIATPIAYYAMNKWLENFAYKTDLSWWIFALAGALALGIALLTVSWQSWKAATRNPVDALRYE
ncbi:MAG: hypothetical protein A2W90_22530 [Bacteroidetes bacterium GWF2_42_66]|nr:MAG: hypothetical protein A2W92_21935 [Bacteroidetes bacterium GWA2_42_15]OFY03109.1 MAG: hypothetical protein A2W89_13310 [Bacteroidetes bacterium GWE2_42_39]OFY45217.1 MAG: hypothetical protein A2W90_22530 [Bacteroidetes bacterium GWF2_42_66]